MVRTTVVAPRGGNVGKDRGRGRASTGSAIKDSASCAKSSAQAAHDQALAPHANRIAEDRPRVAKECGACHAAACSDPSKWHAFAQNGPDGAKVPIGVRPQVTENATNHDS